MKFVIAGTGASGAIYLQRLLHLIPSEHEIHLILSDHAHQVIHEEINKLDIPSNVITYGNQSMHVPFASGSAKFDAMVVIPCSMGTAGRIAAGTSDNTLLRAAEVFLKEKRKLIIVPRETPWSLIAARNIVTLLEAGATVIPAIPSFYSRPQSVEAVADTVVWRVMDHMGVENPSTFRWKQNS